MAPEPVEPFTLTAAELMQAFDTFRFACGLYHGGRITDADLIATILRIRNGRADDDVRLPAALLGVIADLAVETHD